ncbi:SAM-dependent methyltransferase, partial [Klebsiella pneumoniae]|nr:SAM-dependent methyltransferase [Klebsiella pneumoniae]MCP6663665.1 SAM-dependent methyltransferase [Klebsiella pneumoniae]
QDHWVGVFREGETFDLSLDHLKTCVSFLENIKLFNSNLQVIDEAFEYLTVKDAKGEKGQYFTPRHVIDMAVKMLDPNDDEYIIDT